jgi:hypothetical protein
MKFTHLIAALVLVVGFAGCKKKDEAKKDDTTATTPTTEGAAKTTETKAASGRTIPNANGLVVDAPAKWKDNGIGGAAGMHLDADGGMFMVRETSPEEAAKSMADWKKETEEMLFQKWTSADEIPGEGFKALYAMDKITMKGDEPVKDGTTHAFHVRRKIGGKTHDCYGSAAKEEDAKEGLDLCMKVAAK